MIAFMATSAEAQKAGIARATANEPRSYRGRKPSFDKTQLGIIRDMLAQDASPNASSRVITASLAPSAAEAREP